MQRKYLQIVYDAKHPTFKDNLLNIGEMLFPYMIPETGNDFVNDRLVGTNPMVSVIRIGASSEKLSGLLKIIDATPSVKQIKQSQGPFSEKDIMKSANYL